MKSLGGAVNDRVFNHEDIRQRTYQGEAGTEDERQVERVGGIEDPAGDHRRERSEDKAGEVLNAADGGRHARGYRHVDQPQQEVPAKWIQNSAMPINNTAL